MRKNVIKTAWKIFEKILLILLLIVSLIILTQRLSNNEKAFFGYRMFRVETGSMIPKYQIGDVILVKETDEDKIKVGDDVTYIGTSGVMKGKLVTHQVVEVETVDGEKVFHTKGIANNTEDPEISGKQINGVVQKKLHIITWICSLLNNKYIFYFCGILPITILIFITIMKSNLKRYDNMSK